jgi:hypothetical protein
LGVSSSNNNTPKKEISMSKVILGMAISLDGFVNDSRGSVASLNPDLESLQETESLKEAIQQNMCGSYGKECFCFG